MFQTILVPLDGSALSEQALPTAAALAKATGAHLVLVQAVWSTVLPGLDTSQAQLAAVTTSELYLTRIARRLRGTGLAVEIATPYARPVEGIMLEIKLHRADLVIMTTHGRTGPGRWVYGAVAEGVLAKSPVPVWLIRDNPVVWQSSQLDDRPYQLLVALDGSPFAESVLPYAADIARALKWTLHFMRVIPPPASTAQESETAESLTLEKKLYHEQELALDYLTGFAEPLKQAGIEVRTSVRIGQPAVAILEESWIAGVRLVAMATHGRTGLSKLLYGSVAHEVLHRGACPLLLVRPSITSGQPSPVDQLQYT